MFDLYLFSFFYNIPFLFFGHFIIYNFTSRLEKIIPLFARLQPKMQLTQSSRVFPLFDEVDVNRILAEDILIKYCDAIKLDYNHLQKPNR